MDCSRPRREARHTIIMSDPEPKQNVGSVLASLGRLATVGIFLLLFGGFLYFGRAILMPVFCAGDCRAHTRASGQGGQSPWNLALDHGNPHRRILHRRLELGGDRDGRAGKRVGRSRARNLGQHQGEARRAGSAACGGCANYRPRCSARRRAQRRRAGVQRGLSRCGLSDARGRRAFCCFSRRCFSSSPDRSSCASTLGRDVRRARGQAALP